MSPIVIKHFHKIPILMKIFLLIGIPIYLYFFVFGIIYGIGALIAVTSFITLAIAVGGGFFLNYGIKITEKSVTLLNQRMFKRFAYDDISFIKIVFNNETISGEIKTKKQQTFEFLFDGVELSGYRAAFLPTLWSSGLKLNKKFTEESIIALSRCEKVKIINRYTDEK